MEIQYYSIGKNYTDITECKFMVFPLGGSWFDPPLVSELIFFSYHLNKIYPQYTIQYVSLKQQGYLLKMIDFLITWL